MIINFQSAGSPELYKEGVYLVSVNSAAIEKKKDGDTVYFFKLDLTVKREMVGLTPKPVEKPVLKHSIYFDTAAGIGIKSVHDFCIAAAGEAIGSEYDPAEVVKAGQQLVIEVKHTTNKGKTYLNFAKCWSVEGYKSSQQVKDDDIPY